MVKRHKRRKFSGRVCEQIVYTVAGGTDLKTSRPKKQRFQSQEEREEFNTRVSAAKFAALVNANFSPTSYYSTLTLDPEHEVHTAQEMRRIRDNFYRRMAYRYPDAKIVIVYGRGKSTNRFHLHLITDGIPADALGQLSYEVADTEGNVFTLAGPVPPADATPPAADPPPAPPPAAPPAGAPGEVR